MREWRQWWGRGRGRVGSGGKTCKVPQHYCLRFQLKSVISLYSVLLFPSLLHGNPDYNGFAFAFEKSLSTLNCFFFRFLRIYQPNILVSLRFLADFSPH